jgi:hypothetical protein
VCLGVPLSVIFSGPGDDEPVSSFTELHRGSELDSAASIRVGGAGGHGFSPSDSDSDSDSYLARPRGPAVAARRADLNVPAVDAPAVLTRIPRQHGPHPY